MKVKELIEHLSTMDQELDLWTAIDEEGNRYNEVMYAPEVRYVQKGSEYQTDEAWHHEDLINEYGEEGLEDWIEVCLI